MKIKENGHAKVTIIIYTGKVLRPFLVKKSYKLKS